MSAPIAPPPVPAPPAPVPDRVVSVLAAAFRDLAPAADTAQVDDAADRLRAAITPLIAAELARTVTAAPIPDTADDSRAVGLVVRALQQAAAPRDRVRVPWTPHAVRELPRRWSAIAEHALALHQRDTDLLQQARAEAYAAAHRATARTLLNALAVADPALWSESFALPGQPFWAGPGEPGTEIRATVDPLAADDSYAVALPGAIREQLEAGRTVQLALRGSGDPDHRDIDWCATPVHGELEPPIEDGHTAYGVTVWALGEDAELFVAAGHVEPRRMVAAVLNYAREVEGVVLTGSEV